MRRAARVLIALSAALSGGCSTVASGPPVFERTVPIEYTAFAACAFSALDAAYPGEIQFVDLKAMNAVRIYSTQQTGGILGPGPSLRAWDMTVSPAETGSARIQIKALPTVWGATHYADRTWGEVQSCVR